MTVTTVLSPKPILATATAFLLLAIAAPASARFMVCAQQHTPGGCLQTSICHHFDNNGNWTGSVHISYEC